MKKMTTSGYGKPKARHRRPSASHHMKYLKRIKKIPKKFRHRAHQAKLF